MDAPGRFRRGTQAAVSPAGAAPPPGTGRTARSAAGLYDLRSNAGGIAVSGEITLHHERFYLQVQQSELGPECGILYRACRGRRDYAGGNNHFAPLALLNDLPALAERVREVLER